VCPKAEIGHAEQEKAPNEGRKEGRNHEKANQEIHESEKVVTNFVKNRVQEGSLRVFLKIQRSHFFLH
jgi:hypothetical protein